MLQHALLLSLLLHYTKIAVCLPTCATDVELEVCVLHFPLFQTMLTPSTDVGIPFEDLLHSSLGNAHMERWFLS